MMNETKLHVQSVHLTCELSRTEHLYVRTSVFLLVWRVQKMKGVVGWGTKKRKKKGFSPERSISGNRRFLRKASSML
ncbi:MAG TPA: hypothetical protein DCE42_01040 [Myxococcales bacterium]|nr:hypothetical protein [Deltaproteobacteria bacterium]MBU53759.1 hypothetical protein [Deltaproteobacteria bacterium]HAA53306.1 hypothetical protein [Myxococcales bacterium]